MIDTHPLCGRLTFFLQPRTAKGLIGLLTSEFLHANWQHITSNSGPFFVLGFLLCLRGKVEFLVLALIQMFVSNGILWVVGRDGFYIGASGMVFCWFGYLLTLVIFERPVRWGTAIISGVVFFLVRVFSSSAPHGSQNPIPYFWCCPTTVLFCSDLMPEATARIFHPKKIRNFGFHSDFFFVVVYQQ